MLRRSILQIARQNCRPSSSSCLPSVSPKKKTALDRHSFCRFCQSARANAKKNQSSLFRKFSTSTGLSVQPKIMDGAGDRKILNADYEQLVEARNKGVLIIDVREQNEINETGKLPGSIHIPMGDVTNSLTTLSAEAFRSKFEKSKPEKDTKIILSCRSGMRSGKVQEQMQKLGYENVYNYNGGWLDWESRQKV